MSKAGINWVRMEYEIMITLNHPNIMNAIGCFETEHVLIIIMDNLYVDLSCVLKLKNENKFKGFREDEALKFFY